MGEALIEMERLHDLGFGVHWIRPKSKAPVKAKWSGPTRDEVTTLLKEYHSDYGLGVRLGEPSKLHKDGYLAVIDVDIKGEDPRFKKEAFAVVRKAFPGVVETAPCVKSGRGYHFYVRVPELVKSGKVSTSKEEVKVYSPSTEVNRRQKEKLTEDELKKGLRVKNAWEVELMCVGKQVVVPPTRHPDTGKQYEWVTGVCDPVAHSIPQISLGGDNNILVERELAVQSSTPSSAVFVDVVMSSLSDRIVNMILYGEGVTDRSAGCFAVALAMVKSGFTDIEIQSVLTDRTTFLGETAYEHRKTTSRAAAMDWVLSYCIKKARFEASAARAFEDEVMVTPIELGDDDAAAQKQELVQMTDWESKIARSGKNGEGPPKSTLENLVLILENAVASDIFKRNEFALRDHYGCDTPWGGKVGVAISDDDAPLITHWLGQTFRFEPSKDRVFDAITVLSIRNAYNPVKEWLENLPPWDCIPRLDTWLGKHFQAKGDPEYLAQVFRKWIYAMVMRTYKPGADFMWMPIFEGAQGIGKSSFGRILVGKQYALDWLPNLADKDAALALQGIWAVEVGELASLSAKKNDLETVKAYISRGVDKVRPHYGRKWIESPRRCVFYGTTNETNYLRDDSGNRRFKPVEVGQLNFHQLRVDREQLFAEAKFLFDNCLENEQHLDTEGRAKEFELQIQSTKMVMDESEAMIEAIENYEKNEANLGEKIPTKKLTISWLFSSNSVALRPLQRFKMDMRNIKLAAKALRALGYEHYGINGKKLWKLTKKV